MPGDKLYEEPAELADTIAERAQILAPAMAEAAALRGRFWPMHDLLFENPDRLRDADLLGYAHRLRLDPPAVQEAFEGDAVAERFRRDFSRSGTPTFFVNGVHSCGNWSQAYEFARELRDFVE